MNHHVNPTPPALMSTLCPMCQHETARLHAGLTVVLDRTDVVNDSFKTILRGELDHIARQCRATHQTPR